MCDLESCARFGPNWEWAVSSQASQSESRVLWRVGLSCTRGPKGVSQQAQTAAASKPFPLNLGRPGVGSFLPNPFPVGTRGLWQANAQFLQRQKAFDAGTSREQDRTEESKATVHAAIVEQTAAQAPSRSPPCMPIPGPCTGSRQRPPRPATHPRSGPPRSQHLSRGCPLAA